MIRVTALLWVALLVVAGGTVMHVSDKVRLVDRHLADLEVKTRQEQEAIRILGAEWDSLNDPRRIDDLSKRYLSLVSTPIQRVVALEDIPLKPSPEQIARLDAATRATRDRQAPARHVPDAKPVAPAPDAKPAAPAVQVAARQVLPPSSHRPATVAPMIDGVGLILARAERGE